VRPASRPTARTRGSGLRPLYGPSYYAAFVYDPDGYAIEAVTTE
jgi:hypothetical protein